MMSRKFFTLTAFGLVLALFIIQPAVTQSVQPFARVGKIDRINAHRKIIVVNDVRYVLPTSARVYLYDRQAQSADGQYKGREFGNGAVLRTRMHIGFNVEGEGPRRTGRIVEVWILPPNSPKASTE
jgi:hypothetical protein